MNIVFMGTPAFAVPTLLALIEKYQSKSISAVYTKPPKPQGRGQTIQKSPIHLLAEKHNIPVLTPVNFKQSTDLEQLKSLNPDIIIVVAYGLIIPKSVLDIPKMGCINLHPSLLPRWRGAAPIQHTILSGDKESAICTMLMDEGMDTGDLLLVKKFTINEDMTSYTLHDYCANEGAKLMIETIEGIINKSIKPQKQSDNGVTYASKITRENERLNFNQPAYMVNCQIRTFSPRPGAFFEYKGEVIKIIQADFDQNFQHQYLPGTVINEQLYIACTQGILKPTLLQREGRKMLYTDAFLRGFEIPKGTKLFHTSCK